MAKKVTKTVKTMPPTLLVGLGGTGCEIVGKVYDLASEEQQKSIQFVFLDTDANELRERKLKSPQAFTVQTSRKITVGQALRDDPEAYNNTFPINPQLMNKPLTEGAGQIRAVSKLAFDMCVRTGGLDGLKNAINNLQKLDGDSMEQSIRVLIVSTLVGGTGSGILLPVAMYLRNYLENDCNKKPIIRSFCLLPEIFFTGDKKTEIEKSNLRTNAYATLRELDAFMLRADSKPDSEIRKRFSLKMPRAGTLDQYDEYNKNPLDYCFLFDAQNVNGETLCNLEEYKDHAANCIYASSISRLHKRLNSSEDNTILERCAQNGRNRYCGVGTAKLLYPFETVKEYIALSWMKQAMTDDWLRYDNMVAAQVKRQQNSKKNGSYMPPINKRNYYSDSVSKDFSGDANSYFGIAINEETYEIDSDGMITHIPRWKTYLDRISEYIRDNSDNDNDKDRAGVAASLATARQNIQSGELEGFQTEFSTIIQKLRVYYMKASKRMEMSASGAAYSLFTIDNFNPGDERRLEHYLVKDGIPLHPNSARFFLYNLERELKERLKSVENVSTDTGAGAPRTETFKVVQKKVKDFFTAERYTLKTEGGSKNVDILQFVKELELSFFKKGNFVAGARRAISDAEGFLRDVANYYSKYVEIKIIKEALAFIDDLCKNYEMFYEMLADEIKSIGRRIERIEDSFVPRKGHPVINVCTSAKCLSALLDACPNVIDTVELTVEFRTKIFEAIYKKSSADSRENSIKQRKLIDEIVSKDILEFWENSVVEKYPDKVDMDIIQALMAEALYEDDCTTLDEQLNYIKGRYDEALKLASPFIDKPVGQPYEIVACGMKDDIRDEDDVIKTEILKLFGHYEPDSLMSKNQILVMKALYNLKAADLKKFAPADYHPADPRDEGSYYKDYVARIDNVLPDAEKSNIITPHLDRRWHFTGVLPDFDDSIETKRQTEAQKAFLVAFAYDYLRFDRDHYKFVDDNGDFISEQIIVGDGLCDKLHEVYDALSMSRPLVRSFLNRYNATTAYEKEHDSIANVDYTRSRLYKALDNMHLNKYDFIPRVSFLELPLLYKTSVGNGSFNDDDAIVMLRNFIDFIDEYLTNFYDDNIRRVDYLVSWLDSHTTLLFENVSKHYNKEGTVIIEKPFEDTLLSRMLNNIIGKFKNLSAASDKAAECHAKYVELWKAMVESTEGAQA